MRPGVTKQGDPDYAILPRAPHDDLQHGELLEVRRLDHPVFIRVVLHVWCCLHASSHKLSRQP